MVKKLHKESFVRYLKQYISLTNLTRVHYAGFNKLGDTLIMYAGLLALDHIGAYYDKVVTSPPPEYMGYFEELSPEDVEFMCNTLYFIHSFLTRATDIRIRDMLRKYEDNVLEWVERTYFNGKPTAEVKHIEDDIIREVRKQYTLFSKEALAYVEKLHGTILGSYKRAINHYGNDVVSTLEDLFSVTYHVDLSAIKDIVSNKPVRAAILSDDDVKYLKRRLHEYDPYKIVVAFDMFAYLVREFNNIFKRKPIPPLLLKRFELNYEGDQHV